jgi:hypothetical protein
MPAIGPVPRPPWLAGWWECWHRPGGGGVLPGLALRKARRFVVTDLKVRRWTGAFGLGVIALVLFEYHPGWLVCG